MERLLRRHVRRKGGSVHAGSENARETSSDESVAASVAFGAHLDADEMNAYAEGALSDAMRSRYFSHLADCDECRSLVTKLTLAANVSKESSRPASVAAAPTRSWRDWLGALFSPPVLRYGVPAFALLVVMVVAFVALRERRQDSFVAQNEQAGQRVPNSATAPPSTNEQSAQPSSGTTAAPQEGVALNENASAPVYKQQESDATSEASREESQAGKKEAEAEAKMPAKPFEPKPAQEQPAASTDVVTQPRDTDEAVTMAKAQPPVSAPPAARPAPENERRGEEDKAQKSGEFGEKAKTTRSTTSTTVGGIFRDETAARNQAPAASRARKSGGREAAGRTMRADDERANDGAAAGPDAKDDRTTETRSAGGRSFRRQGGAWVDTAYSSARATVNVARGSEQYRALVADEPGIRAIAEQFGGTVIIVWKGRAYRIY